MSCAPEVHSLTCPASLDQLSSMMKWVRDQAAACHLAEVDIRKLELALEEAIVNVINHAYKETKGAIELTSYLYPRQRIELILKDRGFPFNPLLQVKSLYDVESLEECEEGGLGILLMRRYVDEIHYERQHPYNVLTLIKRV